MSLKNLLLRGLLVLEKLFPKHEPQNNRFLIVSTTGLGDTLWATPAIRALRRSFPHAYIGILTSSVGKEVLKNNPHIDDLFVVKAPALPSLLSLFWRLRKEAIGTALIFHTSQRPILPFCRFIGAGQIIGSKGINKGLDSLLTTAIEPSSCHEIERRLKIVGAVGAKPHDIQMELSISEEDRYQASLLIKDSPSYIPLVGLHPGAKDKFKQWPPEHFIEVGKRLKDHLGCRLVITGNKEEAALVQKIANGIEGALPMTSPLSIQQLAALIERFALMISNDTGPMHIACAVKTPVIGLFAPTDAKICGPYFAHKGFALQKRRTCTPCLRKKCHEPFCLRQISKDEVFETALKVFYGH